jgi:hypothetical protein
MFILFKLFNKFKLFIEGTSACSVLVRCLSSACSLSALAMNG